MDYFNWCCVRWPRFYPDIWYLLIVPRDCAVRKRRWVSSWGIIELVTKYHRGVRDAGCHTIYPLGGHALLIHPSNQLFRLTCKGNVQWIDSLCNRKSCFEAKSILITLQSRERNMFVGLRNNSDYQKWFRGLSVIGAKLRMISMMTAKLSIIGSGWYSLYTNREARIRILMELKEIPVRILHYSYDVVSRQW